MKKSLLTAFLFLFTSVLLNAQIGVWGVTSAGGEFNAGVVFKMDGSGNNYAVKQDFFRFDGDYPQSSLFQANDGKLYGMTSSCCTFDAF
ncbi:MAG TPA: choice-of-anchor tandem repeat GloVer-containing protein, partial [Bacteroidia bacterium]|nr:choice-of-anchor tandem repeat GloVer-containing protein [Bacteroidia bacterium]